MSAGELHLDANKLYADMLLVYPDKEAASEAAKYLLDALTRNGVYMEERLVTMSRNKLVVSRDGSSLVGLTSHAVVENGKGVLCMEADMAMNVARQNVTVAEMHSLLSNIAAFAPLVVQLDSRWDNAAVEDGLGDNAVVEDGRVRYSIQERRFVWRRSYQLSREHVAQVVSQHQSALKGAESIDTKQKASVKSVPFAELPTADAVVSDAQELVRRSEKSRMRTRTQNISRAQRKRSLARMRNITPNQSFRVRRRRKRGDIFKQDSVSVFARVADFMGRMVGAPSTLVRPQSTSDGYVDYYKDSASKMFYIQQADSP